MSSLLEQRYRRVLRLLPAGYRDRWGEDMLATFLQQAYAAAPDDPEGVELGSPPWPEVAGVAALALRLRLDGDGSGALRIDWGGALRRFALVGLLAHTVTALVGVLLTLWITRRLPGMVIPPDAELAAPGRWRILWDLSGLLWLPAYLALGYGHRRAARGIAGAALVPLAVTVGAGVVADHGAFALSRGYQLLLAAAPVLALVAFHRDAPPVAARPWLWAVPVGSVALFGATLLAQPASGGQPLLDGPGLWCLAVVAAGAARLGVPRLRRRPDARPWSAALALLALGVLGLRLAVLSDQAGSAAPVPGWHAWLVAGAVEAVAVLGVAAALVTAARRPDAGGAGPRPAG